MRLFRLTTLPLVAALAFLATPQEGEAQLSFGVHVPVATSDLSVSEGDGFDDQTFGLGARVGFAPPLFPLSFWGTVDYFFPDCGDLDCGYQNFALDANFDLPVPALTPYITAGYMARRVSVESASETAHGFSAGAGASFAVSVVSPYIELRREFFDDEDGGAQWLIRLGLMF